MTDEAVQSLIERNDELADENTDLRSQLERTVTANAELRAALGDLIRQISYTYHQAVQHERLLAAS